MPRIQGTNRDRESHMERATSNRETFLGQSRKAKEQAARQYQQEKEKGS